MIINHWLTIGFRGTLFSDTPKWRDPNVVIFGNERFLEEAPPHMSLRIFRIRMFRCSYSDSWCVTKGFVRIFVSRWISAGGPHHVQCCHHCLLQRSAVGYGAASLERNASETDCANCSHLAPVHEQWAMPGVGMEHTWPWPHFTNKDEGIDEGIVKVISCILKFKNPVHRW